MAVGEGITAQPRSVGATASGRGARAWRAVVFAPAGEGVTRRRGSDAVRLIVAVVTVLCCWLITSTPAGPEKAVLHFLTPPPEGVRWLVSTVWWLGSIGVIAALGILALLSRRRNIARDVALSGLTAWLVSLLLVWQIGPNSAAPASPALRAINLGFPIGRVAATVAVITAALPYLRRGLQVLFEITVVLAALATIVHGSGLPLSVLASLALGWGAAATVHLVFGSPLGLPSRDDVVVLLAELDLDASGVEPLPRQVWGVARYRARDADGPLEASVYGRDAAEAQLVAKTLRFIAYRDSGPQLILTRLQQVEHEAYLTLLADRQGVPTATVVMAGEAGPSRDAVLVTRPPPGSRLGDLDETARRERVTDGALEDLFVHLGALRRARVTHGALNADTIVVSDDHRTALLDFRAASSGGRPERFDRDLAAALATLGAIAGAGRTIAAANRVLGPEMLASALPFLHRAALSTGLPRAARPSKELLEELRQQGAEVAGVEVPKLVEPRRISWVNLALAVGTVIGGWALIGVLVNVGQSFGTITGARWGWVIAVFVLSQLAYPSLGLALVGSVIDPIPFGRATALEFANTFVSLAGSAMAALATRVRFFQVQGYSATLAVSSGVVVSAASWIAKGAVFLIALPIGIGSFHFTEEVNGGGGHGHLVWLIVVVVILVGLGLGVVLAVPRLRRLARDKLRPRVAEVWGHLKLLATRPRKMVQLFGGEVAAQLFVAFALGASLHAFHQHLNLAQVIIVLTLSSMVGGVSPVPGGMGVVEAGMIFTMTAAGIPQTEAVAATFVQRLFTAYLPPIWGWFVLVWLRRREAL